MKKRFFGMLMVGLLLATMFGTLSISAYARVSNNDYQEILEEISELRRNDSEFLREAKANKITFMELVNQEAQIICKSRHKRISGNMSGSAVLFSIGNNGNNIYANVPLIQQTLSYNCGPTAILQALYGSSLQGNVTGNTNNDKIATLTSLCGSTSSYGTYVYIVKQCLNSFPFYSTYTYVLASTMTLTSFQQKIESSLYYNMAPILHAQTEDIPYYENHKSGHYIAIQEIDRSNQTITVKDCNINNAYYGTHYISLEDAYNAINPSTGARYLICKS